MVKREYTAGILVTGLLSVAVSPACCARVVAVDVRLIVTVCACQSIVGLCHLSHGSPSMRLSFLSDVTSNLAAQCLGPSLRKRHA